MKKLYFAIALIFVCAGAATAIWQKTRTPAVATLASYHLTDINGRMTHNLIGDKQKLLVNFWATWCVPCQRELPLLAAVAKTLPPDTGIVAISYETPEEITAYIQQHSLTDLTFYSAPISILRYIEQSGNPTKALPYTLLLDRTHTIQARHIGDFKTQPQIRDFLTEN